jgi:DNA-binding CsgD family transcriptional regulator
MKTLITACADIEQFTDIDDVWNTAVATLKTAYVDVVLYVSSDPARGDVRSLATAPEIYGSADPAEDPFLEHCCTSYSITHTGVAFLDDYDYLPEEARGFIRSAAKSGFVSGLGIPMRLEGSTRFGGFNLGTGFDRARFEAEILLHEEVYRLFCLVVHRRLEELGFEEEASADFRTKLVAPEKGILRSLSPREREVIFLQVQGLSRKEVARMCAISPHTVAEYTYKAYRKMGVKNRMEAARLVLAG